MGILRFLNHPQKTLFAPQWDYVIFESNILNEIDLFTLRDTILKNENDVISKYKFTDDWGTGLGENSMTSRSDSYNLLEWPEAFDLKNAIRKSHDEFIIGLGHNPNEQIYVQCWANVLRKGQQIQIHQHWRSSYAYLGGHICIQEEGTSTNYINPFSKEFYPSKNQPGKITLFPNWLEHCTDIHQGEQERITIAFDIITQTVLDEDICSEMKDHWIKI